MSFSTYNVFKLLWDGKSRFNMLAERIRMRWNQGTQCYVQSEELLIGELTLLHNNVERSPHALLEYLRKKNVWIKIDIMGLNVCVCLFLGGQQWGRGGKAFRGKLQFNSWQKSMHHISWVLKLQTLRKIQYSHPFFKPLISPAIFSFHISLAWYVQF